MEISTTKQVLDQARPVAERQEGLAFLLIFLATAEMSYDFAFLNLALPKIGAALHAQLTVLQWVVSGAYLAFGALVLLGGKLADVLGKRQVILAGAILTIIGACTGLAAASVGVLIIGRLLQGTGRALVNPGVLSLLSAEFPEGPRRNRAITTMMLIQSTSAPLGLLLGGALLSRVGWRGVLGFSLILAVLTALSALRLRPHTRAAGSFTAQIDIPGALAAACAIAALVYGFSEAPHLGWLAWRSGGVICFGLASAALFPLIEARSPAPLIPLRIFRLREVMLGLLALAACGGGTAGILTVLIYGFGAISHYTALQLGLALIPFGAIGLAAQVYEPRIVARFGGKQLIQAGLGLLLLADLWLWISFGRCSYWLSALTPQLLVGSFTLIGAVAAFAVVFRGLPPELRGVGAGMVYAVQQIATAVNITIAFTAIGFTLPMAGRIGVRAAVAWGWPALAVVTAGAFIAVQAALPSARPARPETAPLH
jgi:MFS family permease